MGGNLLRGWCLTEINLCDIHIQFLHTKYCLSCICLFPAGLKGSGIQKSIIFGVLAVRYVALPLVGIAVVKGALRLGLVHDNPLYEFVLLLQFALPPAMNIGNTSCLTQHDCEHLYGWNWYFSTATCDMLGTITQLFGAGEMECSVIMLWCYSLASVALTLWSTFFLWLVSSWMRSSLRDGWCFRAWWCSTSSVTLMRCTFDLLKKIQIQHSAYWFYILGRFNGLVVIEFEL